jgi:hypothetical protein
MQRAIRRCQFRLRTVLLVVTGIGVLLGASDIRARYFAPPTYDQGFIDGIWQAVVGGGFRPCGSALSLASDYERGYAYGHALDLPIPTLDGRSRSERIRGAIALVSADPRISDEARRAAIGSLQRGRRPRPRRNAARQDTPVYPRMSTSHSFLTR